MEVIVRHTVGQYKEKSCYIAPGKPGGYITEIESVSDPETTEADHADISIQ